MIRRLLYTALAAVVLVALLSLADALFFAEDFGLWAYTLGAMVGMGLTLLGLLLSIGTILFSKRKGPSLAVGANLILWGVLTTLLALLVWFIAGMPSPS